MRQESQLAADIHYTLAHWPGLIRFLEDGMLEFDTNPVENQIRPIAMNRKNSLFAGSDGGGCTWASIATLLQTCKMNNVDPTAWRTQTLERIASQWPSAEIDALMPWNYRPSTASASRLRRCRWVVHPPHQFRSSGGLAAAS